MGAAHTEIEPAVPSGPAHGPNPYVGSRSYGPEDEDRFFGRDAEQRDIMALIAAHDATLIYAQSGAGKTSLLNARIIPALRRRPAEVIGPLRVGGTTASQLGEVSPRNPFVFNALSMAVPGRGDLVRLQDSTLTEYLGSRPRPSSKLALAMMRVLIFDQFEELFTSQSGSWRQRRAFFEDVGAALAEDARLRVVFAMREEYIASLDPYVDELPESLQARYRIERLRPEAALEAIVGPLEGTGVSFERGAAEALLQSLRVAPQSVQDDHAIVEQEHVEPLHLQVVCERLWDSLPKEIHEIDAVRVKDAGDVDEALTWHYVECLRKVVTSHGQSHAITQGKLRHALETSFITTDGHRALVYRGATSTADLPNAVIEELENQHHLLRTEVRGGAHWYELSHDRLVQPILQSNAEWRFARDPSNQSGKLELRAASWVKSGKNEAELFHGNDYLSARDTAAALQASGIILTAVLQELLARSADLYESTRARRLARRTVQGGLIGAAALAVITGFVMLNRVRETKVERQSVIDAYTEVAQENGSEGDPFNAVMWGIRAMAKAAAAELPPPRDAERQLQKSIALLAPGVQIGAEGDIDQFVFTKDSRQLITTNGERAEVWDPLTGKRRFAVDAGANRRIAWVFVSPRGTWLVMYREQSERFPGDGWEVTTYRMDDGAEVKDLVPAKVRSLSMSEDESVIVYATSSETVLRSRSSGMTRKIPRGRGGMRSDGRVYVVTDSSRVEVRDVLTDKLLARAQVPQANFLNINSSPAGPYIALHSSFGEGMWMFDFGTGRLAGPVPVPSDPMSRTMFSPDDAEILVYGHNEVSIWKRDDLRLIRRHVLTASESELDGRAGGVLALHDAGSDTRIKLHRHFSGSSGLDFGLFPKTSQASLSPDGKLLATKTEKYGLRVWRLDQRNLRPERLTGNELAAHACAQLEGHPEQTRIAAVCARFRR